MPEDFLLILQKKLARFRIPSLSALLARLESAEDFREFMRLVREFLPEREVDILAQPTPAKQIAAFASYFEDRYFPLQEEFKWGEDYLEYSDLIRWIPVVLMGIGYDDYHEIPNAYRPGIQLMTFLVANPYEEDRSALAEACLEHVPRELLEQVPEDGFNPRELRKLLDTEYKGLSLWADIIWHSTGNPFFDLSWEDEGYIDWPNWSREEVEEATKLWQEAEAINEEIDRLVRWLEEAPPARFEELLRFIGEKSFKPERKGE